MVEAADNKRAENITALDVEGISLLADYYVIMQADSNRQVKAIADNIEEAVHKNGGEVKDVEGKDQANWILLDLGDVVVHVFKTETRQFYNLESCGWTQRPLMLTNGCMTNVVPKLCPAVRRINAAAAV